jgi:alkylation response protein AidB-like acyl-CoA dehydrogenase
MDLSFSPEEEAFRAEARAFITENLPADIREKGEAGLRIVADDIQRWTKILHTKGWSSPAWPVEHGGTGWSTIQIYIFEEECVLAHAPRLNQFGIAMVGPVIIAFGNDEQKAHYLPRILSAEDWWCQGYSEPNAGSDLASLSCGAVRDGDDYVVNGTKTWTTAGQWADMIFCLVRTSTEGKKQAGISFLLVDMKSPGITMQPIITIEGGHEVNQVFFDNVAVPVANRIGEENKGWTYAKVLLGHERFMSASVPYSKRMLRRITEIAATEQSHGKPLIEDRRFRERLADTEIQLMALEQTMLRFIAAANAGDHPGPEVSLLKLRGSEIRQSMTELAFEAAGHYAFPHVPGVLDNGWNEPPVGPEYAAPLASQYFNERKISIFAGSNEIQKNIMTKFVLDL